jgi:hypothetical protein
VNRLAVMAGLGLLVLATAGAAVIGDGAIFVVLGPFIALGGLYMIWKLPVRTTLLGMMFIGLAIPDPHERPFAGDWSSPLHVPSKLFFSNLHNTLHLGFLRFSGLEALLLLLWMLLVFRRATGSRIDPVVPRPPSPLTRWVLIGIFWIFALELYGMMRGGDLKQSIFQFRMMLATVFTAYLFQQTLRGPKDHLVLGKIVVWAAVLKVAQGAFFLYFIARPQGLQPPYVTTHTDSITFVVALCILIARWWEAPTGRHLVRGGAIMLVLLFGLVINDRRLAYVGLGGCLMAIYMISPWNRAKRFVTRSVLLAAPLIIAYIGAGWNSGSGVFRPVQVFRTVVDPPENGDSEENSSTEFRDLENLNLIATLGERPFIGWGFGHEWKEDAAKLPDITKIMQEYKYQPHNGLLWLFTLGGFLGFSALWMHMALAVFFAVRTYHRVSDPQARAAMLTVVCVVISYMNQVFGDMGTQSYISTFTVAPAIGIAGQTAVAMGVWASRRTKSAVPAAPTRVAPAPSLS